MRDIRSIPVTAVVLMFALSIFAGSAVAAHDPKDPGHDDLLPHWKFNDDDFPTSGDTFLQAKKAFDERVPDSVFDEEEGVMPGDRVGLPGFLFDDDDQVADGPELQG